MGGGTVEVGDSEIIVERFGRGEPLVLLHGESGPRDAAQFIESLAKTFEVHVPRHVGWSDTRRPNHVRTVRDLALIPQEYIEQLGGPVQVVGLSFGGWVAAEIATNAPSLISRLVLISPIGVKIGQREDRDFADLYLLSARDREAIYYSAGREPPERDRSNVDLYLEAAIADEAIARFCWQPYMHDPTLAGRLRRVRASTLILSGDRDSFVLNADYYSAYAGLIPGARHEVVGGTGHRLEEEEPQAVADRIASFFTVAVPTETAAA